MLDVRLGSIVYDGGAGVRVDEILARVARDLREAGSRLAGAVQYNTCSRSGCRCDMTLEDLASGQLVAISEDRGPEARGCRLNSAALEEIVGLASVALENEVDILIVNKFGKREAEGHGFRQVIETAAARGVPVLVAVSRENLDAWNRFAMGADARLGAVADDISTWCRSVTATGLPTSSNPHTHARRPHMSAGHESQEAL